MRKIVLFLPKLLIAFFVMIVPSCKKNAATMNADAIVINTGPVEADGCGWLIKIKSNGVEYSPTNLTAAFQKDSLQVNVSYTLLTTKFGCGNIAGFGGVPQIKIESIK
jgi:hypothetical protein